MLRSLPVDSGPRCCSPTFCRFFGTVNDELLLQLGIGCDTQLVVVVVCDRRLLDGPGCGSLLLLLAGANCFCTSLATRFNFFGDATGVGFSSVFLTRCKWLSPRGDFSSTCRLLSSFDVPTIDGDDNEFVCDRVRVAIGENVDTGDGDFARVSDSVRRLRLSVTLSSSSDGRFLRLSLTFVDVDGSGWCRLLPALL